MHLPISHEVYRYSFRGYQAAIYLVWPTGHQEPPQRMILEITHPSRAAHTVHVESRYRSVELALLTGRCLFKHYVRVEELALANNNTDPKCAKSLPAVCGLAPPLPGSCAT